MLSFFLLLTLSSAFVESVPHREKRLAGGTEATIEQYPHQVALYIYDKYFCGGSIYSKNVVISAANCFFAHDISKYKIYAGTTLLSEKKFEFSILKFYIHEDYNNGFENDICVVIINGEFEFNNKIQAIPLAESLPQSGSEVITIGWGSPDNHTEIETDNLQELRLNFVDQIKCNETYKGSLTDNIICAEVNEGNKGPCNGDEGDPLIFDRKLLGVLSWGRLCFNDHNPETYASIPKFRDWIEKTVEKHFYGELNATNIQ